jgi:peptide-methionine (S)-S-oxide reductase
MKEYATIGGGCFWCTEAIFQLVKGVTRIVSGYAGGKEENPSYHQVSDGITGHAEVIQIDFDPTIVTYGQLLQVFYYVHDPTTLNRQGNDVGTQYRSIILYHDDNQRETAEKVTNEFAPTLWEDPVVTEIVRLEKFWPAEDYHQNYFNNNPEQAYCQVIINPKLQKFKKEFVSLLK